MTKIILKDIKTYLKKEKFNPQLDNKHGVLTIENYCTIVIEEKENIIGVSFACGFDATIAAIITKHVVNCCFGKYKGYEVDILEPYLNIFDDKGKCIEVLFGDEAIDYYNKFMEETHQGHFGKGQSYEL